MTKLKFAAVSLLLIVILISLVDTAYALPPIPSSFYGEVHITDGAPSVGSTVEAFVTGVTGVAASTTLKLDSAKLVYNINIPGDLPETAGVKEGGVEGDLITFQIGTRIVATGIWHGGTNAQLNIHPPAANAGTSYSGIAGASISFSGAATDWGTDIDTYEWDWNNDGTYDETAQNPTHSWSDIGSYTVGLKATDLQKGEGKKTATVTINPAPVTVTANSGQTKVFGQSDPLSYTYTSSIPAVSFTGALTRVAGETVGAYAIQQGSLDAGPNYIITFVPANFTITPKPITVTADSGKTKVFGGTDPAFTYTSSDPVSFTGALSRVGGENAGTYAITPGTLSAGSSYSITLVSANFTITPKPITVTPDSGKTKVFGGTDPVFTYTSSDPVTFTGALSRVGEEDVAAYAITIGSLTAGSNYSITLISVNFTITPKPITVTATAGQTKVFGAANPVYAYTYSPSSPIVAFTGALARAIGENVGTTYAINQGTLTAGSNYTITFVSANFSITPKPITITAAAKTKAYGDADTALTYTSSDVAAPFTGALTRAPGTNVGVYEIQQGDLSAGANYTITYVPANLTITPKPITVTVTAGQSKVFGTAEPVFAYTYSPSSPIVAFTGALARAIGENVGTTYAINQNTLTAGSNYTITFVSANFSITPKPITVTAAAKTKVYGDVDPALTYTSSDPAAPFTGALTRAPGTDVGVYAILQDGLSAGANYTITYIPANLTITPKPATVTLSNLNYVYDGTAKSATVTTNPVGLAVGITYAGSAVAPSAAGSYAVLATITNPNYSGSASGTLVISAYHSIALVSGWNLVSFNVHPTSTVATDVLASVDGNYDLVYAWDATGSQSGSGNWLKYDPSVGFGNTLLNLDEKMGFWIHVTSADTLMVVGSQPVTTNIQLLDNTGGWNLVGYPSAVNYDLPGALNDHGIGTAFSLIYAYHASDIADPWNLFDRLGPVFANDLTQMIPGWGYWIKVTADNIWSVGY